MEDSLNWKIILDLPDFPFSKSGQDIKPCDLMYTDKLPGSCRGITLTGCHRIKSGFFEKHSFNEYLYMKYTKEVDVNG
jgi:hypothetical protein